MTPPGKGGFTARAVRLPGSPDEFAQGHEETLAAYGKARGLDPGNPAVSDRYARYLASQYRYEEAEEILRDAEKKSPEDTGVLRNLASLLVYLSKEPAFASRLIERGSRVDPGRAEWRRLSGVIRKRRELGIAPKAKGVNQGAGLRPVMNIPPRESIRGAAVALERESHAIHGMGRTCSR